MIIVGINLSHDASICVLKDGEIVHYQEAERLTHQKHCHDFYFMIQEVFSEYKDNVDLVAISYFHPHIESLIEGYLLRIMIKYCGEKIKILNSDLHHWHHATNAFYGSTFESAGVLVIDGGGQRLEDTPEIFKHETESIYTFERGQPSQRHVQNLNSDMCVLWQIICEHFGLSIFDSGKVMGASAYGEDNPKHPRAYIGRNLNQEFFDWVSRGDISYYDASYRLQHDSFDVVCQWVEDTISITGQTNICCSGGYFMNVVNNYKLVEKYPHINFYFDPICTDNGTSIGIAKNTYYEFLELDDNKIIPLNSLYLGTKANYYDVEEQRPTNTKEVAQLIADRNVVAIYQGSSEAGPRALGNRSFLYDPRDPNGRDVVNTIKKREHYRPFAGSVLEEHAHDWFEMLNLESAPFMSYAIPCKKDKRNLVPALQHEDGTSRIQTVNREQNKHYYDLIQSFYELTDVPMILNTSFNLAGDTMVDNFDDAIRTCKEGNIRYLYLPEKQMLVDFGE